MKWPVAVLAFAVSTLISHEVPLAQEEQQPHQAETAAAPNPEGPDPEAIKNLTLMARFYDNQPLATHQERHSLAKILLKQFRAISASIAPLDAAKRKEARDLIARAVASDNKINDKGNNQLIQHYRAERSYGRIVTLLSDLAAQQGNSPAAEMKLWAQLSESLAAVQGHRALRTLIESGNAAPIDWIEGCPTCLAEGRQAIGRTILSSILIPYLADRANAEFLKKMHR